MDAKVIEIKTVETPGKGSLSFFEADRDIPFEIKRIYYTYGVPVNVHRGGHAHRILSQVLVCLYGQITVDLDDGFERQRVVLDSPSKGLVIGNAIWREMTWDCSDAVLMVAASEVYRESDYIRDYSAFLDFARGVEI